jgi:SRSO17 transposase
LPPCPAQDLTQHLQRFWYRHQDGFTTKTRDTSAYALHYLTALLRLQTERNFTNIGNSSAMSPQNIQHFMSNSPWDVRFVLWKVVREIALTPALQQGGVLILDESADEKSSTQTVGAGRQYNGRLGKVDMSQVGTFLAFAHLPTSTWTWVDGELFVPEDWFSKEKQAERERLGIPEARQFATKIALGWQMIQRVKADRLPFEMVACDALYGQANWFRHKLDQAKLLYMAAIPSNTLVAPLSVDKQADLIWSVEELAQRESTLWQEVSVRPTERGHLTEHFACRRVFTWRDETASGEWLVLRKDSEGKIAYALCNAPEETPLSQLAEWACVRYFVERANQDAKSEAGFADLRAQKWLAWEHHLALTILACWFVAQTKLEWREKYPPDPTLLSELQVDRLPTLSMANVREMLRAVLPLPQLTPEEASRQVVKHLFGRTQSRKSRLKKLRKPPG